MNMKKFRVLPLVLSLLMLLASCSPLVENTIGYEYEDEIYIELSGNVPEFSEDEITTKSFEKYAELDYLGRCGVAVACIGQDIMPTSEREAIGQVKPTGWQLVKYDNVDGKYLYNRCHLIGYQLTGENANEKNLITGTRFMNVEGMLPFENLVADYIKETNNHVLYRVTPVFEGKNLLAKGVKIEALSVEDNGAGVCFNVFVFNVQPGIKINYADGTSIAENKIESQDEINDYILNTNTKKIHDTDCPSVNDIRSENKQKFTGTKSELTDKGYTPCARCMQ